jgi:hypothetical protein
MRSILAIIAMLVATASSAQLIRQRVLLPVVVETPVPGAHGSLWTTQTALVNTGLDLAFVYGIMTGCPVPVCPGENAIGANTTLYPHMSGLDPTINAHLIEVEGGTVAVQLTVQDRSRAFETWGTSVPAVAESDAWITPFQLLDVPGDSSRFRTLVRIYSFTPMVDASVRIRIFRTNSAHNVPYEDNQPDELLAERLMPLRRSSSPYTPGYADLPLWTVAGINSGDRLRVEVVPITQDIRFWAMASITNNETQHVTIVSPH